MGRKQILKLIDENASPVKVDDVVDKEKMFYVTDPATNTVKMFGQYYPIVNESISAINVNLTSVMLHRYEKDLDHCYCIYGEGEIDTHDWHEWCSKSFKNSEVKRIKISKYNTVVLTMNSIADLTKLYENLPWATVERISDYIYKVTINPKDVNGKYRYFSLNVPDNTAIEYIEISLKREKEYFGLIPYAIYQGRNIKLSENGVYYIAGFVLTILIALFIWLIVFYRKNRHLFTSESPNVNNNVNNSVQPSTVVLSV